MHCALAFFFVAALQETPAPASDATQDPPPEETAPETQPPPVAPAQQEQEAQATQQNDERRVLSVAVYDLAVVGIPARTGKLVTTSLLAEVRKLVGVSVIGMDDVRAMLEHEANKQLTGCEQESCLADVADALGVDVIVVGSLATIEGQNLVELKRIDQSKAQVAATFTKRLTPENGEELLAAIGPAVETLFPERALLPGRTRGVDPELALRLNPPPLPRWSFFTIAGASALMFVSGATASVVAAASGAEAEAALVRSTREVVDGKDVMDPYRAAVASTIVADSLYAAGLVAAAAAGVSALFVDWKGYADADL